METECVGASLSKWPSAVMISGIVADGIMSYDDEVSKYVDWWEKEGSGSHSNSSKVTLRDLLSFTSGLMEDPEQGLCLIGFMDCAEDLYKKALDSKHGWELPGTTFQYLSGHLQFAGAMAVAASGKPIEELFEKYLFNKYNMTGTKYGPTARNPSMAAGIISTGHDFEKMLHSLLTYTGLPKTVLDQMETDWTKPPVGPSGDGWFGHYAMGHWWECLGYGTPDEREDLPAICTDAHIQAGPGEFGYYPLIDRSGGGGKAGPKRSQYYMQVVLQEPDPLSGIPEYLRLVTKPIVDIIMSGGDPTAVPKGYILANGGGLLARDVTFIKGELERCSCTHDREFDFQEPYKSLTKGQPEDRPKLNRNTLLAQGEGLTLFEVAAIQQTLGKCTCKGRSDLEANATAQL